MARVSVYQLIQPFEEGSKAVEIHKCGHKKECRFKGCEKWIIKHIERAREMLKDIGMDADSVKVIYEEKK
jgi:coenzyme F420-reducing hydrogenase delta subunit